MIEFDLTEARDALKAGLHGPNTVFKGCVTDSRQVQTGQLYVALRGERFDGHEFCAEAESKGAAALLVEEEVKSRLPQLRVGDSRKALGQLAALWRKRFHIPVIAITGSNGKTTVKEMLKSILGQSGEVLATQGNLNNDIGLPLTLFNLNSNHRYAVLEMGANHPGEIAYLSAIARPAIAAITQCAPAHLEGFEDEEGVARAKGEIFSALDIDGTAIINRDDAYAGFWVNRAQPRRIIDFSLALKAAVSAGDIEVTADGQSFTLYSEADPCSIQLPLSGRHNISNALAAAACALAAGCSVKDVVTGLEGVSPVPGRLQAQTGIRGIHLIDDSYNANPASVLAAIKVLQDCPAPRWLVLGDMLELGEEAKDYHSRIGVAAREAGIEHLLCFGPLSKNSMEAFGQHGRHFVDISRLLMILEAEVQSGASVLVKGSRGMHMERAVAVLQER